MIINPKSNTTNGIDTSLVNMVATSSDVAQENNQNSEQRAHWPLARLCLAMPFVIAALCSGHRYLASRCAGRRNTRVLDTSTRRCGRCGPWRLDSASAAAVAAQPSGRTGLVSGCTSKIVGTATVDAVLGGDSLHHSAGALPLGHRAAVPTGRPLGPGQHWRSGAGGLAAPSHWSMGHRWRHHRAPRRLQLPWQVGRQSAVGIVLSTVLVIQQLVPWSRRCC